MNIPKVLIGCPTSNKKDYCTFDWIDNVREFSYPNTEILLVDNSDTLDFQEKVLDYGVNCVHVKKEGNATQFVARSANVLRNYALQHGFDYLMMVEIDNFPRTDIIEYLMRHYKPVVSCTYFLNSFSDEFANMGLLELYGTKSLSNRIVHPHQGFEKFDGTLQKWGSNSIGCCLIDRKVLQSQPFRADPNKPGVFHDTLFFEDLRMKGIPCYVDMGYICEHRRGSWIGNKDLEKAYK